MKLASLTAAAALLLATAGCGGEDDGSTTADPAALEGTGWILSEGIETSGWDGAAPSVSFRGGRFGGSDGCNLLGGSYEADGSPLRIEDVSSTAMACGPPAGEAGKEFTAAVEAVEIWGLDGEELVLSGGDTELRFLPASVEGSWRVTSLLQDEAVATLPPGAEITAEFSADGGISGSACNMFGGSYRARGSSISIDGLYSTEMACEFIEQEVAFLTALPRAAEFQIERGNLVLLTAKGTVVATLEPVAEGESG